MRVLILCIRIFDCMSNRIITHLFRLQQLLTGLLPALAPPAKRLWDWSPPPMDSFSAKDQRSTLTPPLPL